MASSGQSSTEDDHSELLGHDEVVRLWLAAIEQRDCKTLMLLLKDNLSRAESWIRNEDDFLKFFVCQWAGKHRSALHVAAMQGCFPLAKQLLDFLVNQEHYPVDKEHTFVVDYIQLKDEASGLMAWSMAHNIVGDHSVAELISYHIGRIRHDGKQGSLFEATRGTPWYRTMLQYITGRSVDEKKSEPDIMSHLRENSRLLLETLHGIPILHLALCRNDIDMMKQVLELFGNRKEILWDSDQFFPHILPLETLVYKYHSIHSIPDHVVEGEYMTKRVKRALMDSYGSLWELAEYLKHEDFWTIVSNDFDQRQVASEPCHFNDTAKKIAVGDLLSQVYWSAEWDTKFNDDVDYNFVDPTVCPRSFFRIHHACKDPHKFQDFFDNIGKNFKEKSNKQDEEKYTIEDIFGMHDPQGRTPWHILVDYFIREKLSARSYIPDKNLLQIFPLHKCNFDQVFDQVCVIQDRKGRSLYDCAFSKSYLHCNTFIRSRSSRKTVEFMHSSCEKFSLEQLQMAILTNHTKDVQQILTTMGQQKFDTPNHYLAPLLLAASLGDQAILELLLEAQYDPMDVDEDGRSSLHHAADASLLEFPIITQCFSTVDDLCKVRKKWTEERDGEVPELSLEEHSTFDDKCKCDKVFTKKKEKNLPADTIAKLNVERKACILMLVQAGVDLSQADKFKKVPKVGPTSDGGHKSWWYDMVVNDTTEKKNSFNQAGNALSVVGALVAATSYIGPLQPPLGYDDKQGFVDTTQRLVEVFMVSNTLAFYLAMASVMFAVVPSLPMPQEGVMSELRRARHIVSFSLCLLILAAGCIMVSFGAASLVVMNYEHSFHQTDLLFWPSIIGWSFCFFAIVSFLIRVMRLIFYGNPLVRQVYEFSFSNWCKDVHFKIRKWKRELDEQIRRDGGLLGYIIWHMLAACGSLIDTISTLRHNDA